MSSKINDIVTLKSISSSTNLGLLALRVWLGLSMILLHGLDKLKNFSGTVKAFGENMGIPVPFASAAIISETVFAVLLVFGLGTRWAAAFLATTMAVAFFKVHGGALSGPQSGELAFIYLAGFITVLIAGAGRLSVDAKLSK